MRGKHATSLREATATAVSLDEPLPSRRLEETQVLAGGRLADPDRVGRSGDSPLAADLDQEAHPRRIPEKPKRSIGHDDRSYWKKRLDQ
jgi:hypothetical protein